MSVLGEAEVDKSPPGGLLSVSDWVEVDIGPRDGLWSRSSSVNDDIGPAWLGIAVGAGLG